MNKTCNYIKVVIIPHEIAEIFKNLVLYSVQPVLSQYI